MSYLITGGAGTLGREIVRQIRAASINERIVVFSRDEGKQVAMMDEFPEGGATGIRYMLGDIRDTERLEWALRGIDTVIHTAAIKMIDWADYNAFETISVNVTGTISVAKACIRAGVKRAVAISTDKAVDPVGVYGQSKLLMETAFIQANNYGDTKFNVVRYGNVAYAAKSCFHRWEQQSAKGEKIAVTHPDMTRFFWSIEEAGAFVLLMLREGDDDRGLVYVPKMRSFRLVDIARMYGDVEIVGMRCPEKLHEQLWTETESVRCRECSTRKYYMILPHTHRWGADTKRLGIAVKPGMVLTSEQHCDMKETVMDYIKGK